MKAVQEKASKEGDTVLRDKDFVLSKKKIPVINTVLAESPSRKLTVSE